MKLVDSVMGNSIKLMGVIEKATLHLAKTILVISGVARGKLRMMPVLSRYSLVEILMKMNRMLISS